MVMFPNGGMSDGNGSMRPIEDEYHSLSTGDAPRFKVRKVSANRQFPHMCGPEYQHYKVEPEETAAESGGEKVALNLDSKGGVMTESGLQDQPAGAGTSTGLEVQENAGLLFRDTGEKSHEANGAQMLPLEAPENHLASEKLVNCGSWDNVFNGGDAAAIDLDTFAFEMEIGEEAQPHEVVGSPVEEERNESVDMMVERALKGFGLDMDEGSNQMVSMIKDAETESVKDHESKGMNIELPREAQPSVEKLVDRGVEALGKRTNEDRGKKSCSDGGFVIHEEEERNESVDMTAERALKGFVLDMDEGLNQMVSTIKDVETESVKDHESKGMNIELLKKVQPSVEKLVHREVEALGKKTNEDGGKKPCSEGGFVIHEEVSAPSSKEKFLRGSFSAKRDFPLYCGLDAVAPPAEEDQNVGTESIDTRAGNSVFGSGQEDNVMNALVAAKNCPWRQPNVPTDSGGSEAGGSASPVKPGWRGKTIAKKSTSNAERLLLKKLSTKSPSKPADTILTDEGETSEDEAPRAEGKRSTSVEVGVLISGAGSSINDARANVKGVLRTYQTVCRKLLQGEEARFEEGSKAKEKIRRIDLEAAKILKQSGKVVNTEPHHFIGPVPGVEVGDEFQYRVELAIVGIHRIYQGGIDYATLDGQKVAVSIVASGGYDDDLGDPNVLIYSGQGGNPGKDKQAVDQKLERGNLALWNSKTLQNPVRVVRGTKENDQDKSKSKIVTKYVYDGLYTVEDHWQETGEHGKRVYMFKLRRNEGQQEVAWKELKASKKVARVRLGVCIDDIAQKKELYPIGVVNTVDDEKPSAFTYTKEVMFPESFQLQPGEGCSCSGKCSGSRCSCAMRNGGEIPYNRNGAIVETKSIVYECGPHCKCPPSCYNRVSQSGIKLPLEVFKTDERGWGVRALSSISSGSFICEYTGEILDEKEAEKRSNDVYLFDIGQRSLKHSDSDTETGGEGSYTIDALRFGNVGRFINHSCSPNLYAQNVLFDHKDKRVPHIMLFAAENIPPLQELTYDYNYTLDQVRDSNGNIKVKECRCGATGCKGRLY